MAMQKGKNTSATSMQLMIGTMPLNGEENDTSQQPIERLSTHKFKLLFSIGKKQVEYHHDGRNLLRDRVQVSLQGLVPVCGEFVSPDGIKFVGTCDLQDFL